MPYQKIIKRKIEPDESQKEYFKRMFGHTRYVWNQMLDVICNETDEDHMIDYDDLSYMLTLWKDSDDASFLKEADATALQQTLRDLYSEYVKYYTAGSAFPEYRKKRNKVQTYKTACTGNNIYIKGDEIKIPKAGMVKIIDPPVLGDDKICSIVVEKDHETYWLQINIGYIDEEEQPLQAN